jgi:hypothetical protein
MPNPLDLVGHRFGRLVVIAGCHSGGRRRQVQCRCDCGAACVVAVAELRRGETQSCGCLRREQLLVRSFRHGEAGKRVADRTPEYRAWQEMKRRCYDPQRKHFGNYGGRGIRVCDAWRESFPAFLADVGRRPPGCSLDRIDPNGDYEPANVRWANARLQRRNQRQPCVMLAGQQFGRLRVVDEVPAVGREVRWRCLCACGAEVIVSGAHLTSGHTKSCGCIKREHPRDPVTGRLVMARADSRTNASTKRRA